MLVLVLLQYGFVVYLRLEQALRLLVPSNKSSDNISPRIFVSLNLLTGVFVPDKDCPGSDNFLKCFKFVLQELIHWKLIEYRIVMKNKSSE